MSDEENQPSYFPKTEVERQSFYILIVAVLVVIFGLAIIYVNASSAARNDINNLVSFFSNDDKPTANEDQYQIKLWTPTEATLIDLNKHYKKDGIPNKYTWQTTGTEAKTKLFIDHLFKDFGETNITGLRIYEVSGYGASRVKKRGNWWVITFEQGIKPESVYSSYREFWEPGSKIYMEVFGKPSYINSKANN